MKIIKSRLNKAFDLTVDLYKSLKESDYQLKIPKAPSNSFAGQVWCIIGARESYLKALKNGKWSGFSCSVEKGSKEEFLEKLSKTKSDMNKFLNSEKKFSSFEKETLLDLLEHEVQHHGQLIRFVYSNKLKFPKSWNERYTV